MKIDVKNLVSKDYYLVGISALMIGIGAGFASFSLHYLVDLVSGLLKTTQTFTVTTYFFSLVFALASYLLTTSIFKDTNGSGIPQVKLALAAFKGKMPRRMPLGKFVTSFLTLCSGLSFGKEGPLVTISAAWAHLIAYLFRLNRQLTKILVASGATAGLAAAFNTPIAAVVFTIEEIMGELNTRYLGPIILTSVIGSVTSYKLLGSHAVFPQLHYGFHIEWHLVFYLLLGLLMSLVGFVFTRSILTAKAFRQNYFAGREIVFVIFAVSFAAICSQITPGVLGDGTNTINQLLLGKGNIQLGPILILFLLKLILSSSSYSSGLSGGLFMPVLFLGAIGGSAFGMLLTDLGVTRLDIGAFALIGMTSLLVAVIRTPFTAFVMLFEMTRDYDLILPLMTSSLAAYWLSELINPESVYESVAEYEGVHLPTAKDNECLSEMAVEDCMVRKVITLDYDANIDTYKDKINHHNFGGYPVLKNGKLVGIVNRYELRMAIENEEQIKVKNLLKYVTISIYPDQNLLIALDRMKRFEIGRLPVVSRVNDKKLLGIITPEDIVNYLGLTRSEAQEE